MDAVVRAKEPSFTCRPDGACARMQMFCIYKHVATTWLYGKS